MTYCDSRIVNFSELKNIIDSCSKLISVPKNYYPTFDNVKGDATPNIEIDKIGYYYVISERGNEYDRRFTPFLDQLLFWIFRDITFRMSSDYELENRINNQDSRILLFSYHIDLMSKIKQEYADMIKKDYDYILGQDNNKK
jgi:hypothetical protein